MQKVFFYETRIQKKQIFFLKKCIKSIKKQDAWIRRDRWISKTKKGKIYQKNMNKVLKNKTHVQKLSL